MPELARFFGIRIMMHAEKGGRHHAPHIHARYGGAECVFGLDGSVLQGSIPAKQEALVRAWLIMREKELAICWEKLNSGEQVGKIRPLD